jgi:hypothetical protein
VLLLLFSSDLVGRHFETLKSESSVATTDGGGDNYWALSPLQEWMQGNHRHQLLQLF